MRLIPYSELTAAPWKNGGGETREIAAFPPGAGFDDFDWRLSIATIAGDGAFSAFPGIDRTLVLLSGNGVALQLDDGAEQVLKPGDLLAFAGEQAVRSRLLDGIVRDLNFMGRRGRATARVDRVALQDRASLDLGPGGGAVVLRDGRASLPDGTGLGQGDTILCDPGRGERVTLTGRADLVVVRFGLGDQPVAG
ncbi:HutD family protein [Paracoccus shandongensis]|uniref:HutD/Ves family protein n=1 Tax=Paracoccus shandongensis TaxID=2816048 RepID=UPI001A8EC546|nr:HutD family protein [Paracoccus shandongensis]